MNRNKVNDFRTRQKYPFFEAWPVKAFLPFFAPDINPKAVDSIIFFYVVTTRTVYPEIPNSPFNYTCHPNGNHGILWQ